MTRGSRLQSEVEAGVGAAGELVHRGMRGGGARPVDVAFRLDGQGPWTGFDVSCGSFEKEALVKGAAGTEPLGGGRARAIAEDARCRKEAKARDDPAVQLLRRAGHRWHAIGCGPFGSVASASMTHLRALARTADATATYTATPGQPGRIAELFGGIALATIAGAAAAITVARATALLPAWTPASHPPTLRDPQTRSATISISEPVNVDRDVLDAGMRPTNLRTLLEQRSGADERCIQHDDAADAATFVAAAHRGLQASPSLHSQ